jgi:hypothetical protein
LSSVFALYDLILLEKMKMLVIQYQLQVKKKYQKLLIMALADNEKYGHSGRQSQSESQAINSETMETKDPAINQHHDDSSDNVNHEYSDHDLNAADSSEDEDDDNDTEDPYFQKNAEIARDRDDDLEDKNTSGRDDSDNDYTDPDFDQDDTSDLQNDNYDEENDSNFSNPDIEEEEDTKPNVKDQDPYQR